MCNNPIVARVVGTNANGKKILQFLSDKEFFVRAPPAYGPAEPREKYFATPARRYAANFRRSDDDIVFLPCGNCPACNLARAREWSSRMALELPYYRPGSVYFVTLTYDEMHVPWYIPDDSDFPPVQTLRKRDIQLLIKRIRKTLPPRSFRYYVVGEYGPKTLRPHYHAIFYGLEFPDLVCTRNSHSGSPLYESDLMYSFWSDLSGRAKGNVYIAPVSVETCIYTARYTAKKMLGDNFKSVGNESPFQLMSQKPPFARRWYDDNPEWYLLDGHYSLCYNGAQKDIQLPSVFYRWLAADDPDLAAALISDRRERGQSALEGALSNTTLDTLDYLRLCGDNLQYKLSHNKRSVL